MKLPKKNGAVPYREIVISGKRLMLRPYKFSDFTELQKTHSGRLPAVGKFDKPLGTARISEYEKFKDRVRHHRALAKGQLEFIFGVFDKKTGNHLGEIGFLTINRQIRWANIGYHIQNQFFGQGYACEACRLGLKVAFNKLGFHRIEAAMELDHKASRRVALKIGLRFEGKRRKFFPTNGGIDMNVFATNSMDWPAI